MMCAELFIESIRCLQKEVSTCFEININNKVASLVRIVSEERD